MTRPPMLRVAMAVAGSPPLALGLCWLYLFILTDYRAHHRIVMIPMGLVAVVVGLCLVIPACIPSFWREE